MSVMPICTICRDASGDAGLIDSRTGDAYHAACAVERVPLDLVIIIVAFAALAVLPAVLVWAG